MRKREAKDDAAIKRQVIELARELMPDCPHRLINAFVWIMRSPQEAEYLCGYRKPDPAVAWEITTKMQNEARPEYMALMMYRNRRDEFVKMKSEDMEDNSLKNRENESN